MPSFIVTTYSTEERQYVWRVEAEDAEDAKRNYANGSIIEDMFIAEIDEEVASVEEEEEEDLDIG